MNPFLKKICRERGISKNPKFWQESPYGSEPCPNCMKHAGFTYNIEKQIWFCLGCDKKFIREGYGRFKEVNS